MKFWRTNNEITFNGRNKVGISKKREKAEIKVATLDIQIKRSVLRVSNSKCSAQYSQQGSEVNCEDPEVGFKKIGGRLETDNLKCTFFIKYFF